MVHGALSHILLGSHKWPRIPDSHSRTFSACSNPSRNLSKVPRVPHNPSPLLVLANIFCKSPDTGFHLCKLCPNYSALSRKHQYGVGCRWILIRFIPEEGARCCSNPSTGPSFSLSFSPRVLLPLPSLKIRPLPSKCSQARRGALLPLILLSDHRLPPL